MFGKFGRFGKFSRIGMPGKFGMFGNIGRLGKFGKFGRLCWFGWFGMFRKFGSSAGSASTKVRKSDIDAKGYGQINGNRAHTLGTPSPGHRGPGFRSNFGVENARKALPVLRN